MSAVGSFLPNVIKSLPSWVINIIALVLLILFVILSLAPRMITGTLICTTHEGLRCAQLSINGNFDGRDVRTQVVSGTGTFYVPVYSLLSEQRVTLYHVRKDVEIPVDFPVTFDVFPVWAGKQFNITIEEKSPGKFVKTQVELVGGNWLALLDNWITATAKEAVPSAEAAELMTYEQLLKFEKAGRKTVNNNLQLPADTLSKQDADFISDSVKKAIEETAESSSKVNSPEEPLLKFSIQDMENLNKLIEKNVGTAIRPEHWQYITSEESAVEYVKSLKGLEKKYPGVFDNANQGWAKTQSEFQALTGQTIVVVPNM